MKSLVLRASNMVLPRCQPAITTYEQKTDATMASSGGLRGYASVAYTTTFFQNDYQQVVQYSLSNHNYPVRSEQVNHLGLPETFGRPLRLLGGFSSAAS